MKKFPFWLPLAVLFLSACSATGPKFTAAPRPSNSEALIYVYRPNAPFYGGIQSHFYVDGHKIASLNKEGYSAFYVPPGVHMLKQHWTRMDTDKETIQFQVECKPGETRYYRLSIALSSFRMEPGSEGVFVSASHQWAITDVPESEALDEIGLTHYQPPFVVKEARKIGAD